jgi:hypothetical protein
MKRLFTFAIALVLVGLAFSSYATYIPYGPTPIGVADIGTPGAAGFGVGICPPQLLPAGMLPMDGFQIPTHPNYGNYQYKDGSIVVFIPRFYYKITSGAGTATAIASIYDYPNEVAANAAEYAIHRAFIDGGIEQVGFFVDKYENSKNAWGTGYIASSIKNGLPISTASAHNPIADLTACTGNNYYWAAIDAAHARDGVNGEVNASSIWHVQSRFQWAALAMLSLAHGQAATHTAYCAWYDATYNYPLGLNNNLANADVDVAGLVYTTDGYSNAGKAGSGVPFNKTTHNGQACGVADMNGNMYEINIGMTCIASAATAIESMSQASPCVVGWTGHGMTTGDWVMISDITQADWSGAKDKMWQITEGVDGNSFTIAFNASEFGTAYNAGADPGTVTKGEWYAANESTAMKTFTSGNSGETDHWGATGVEDLMTKMTSSTLPFESGGAFAQRYGSSTNQVLDEATSGDGWILTGLGLPQDSSAIDTTGTNQFGKDYFYQYVRNEMCVLSGGYWAYGSSAGVWSVYWHGSRASSGHGVSFRLALYPE